MPLLATFAAASVLAGNLTHYRAAAVQYAPYIVHGPPNSANVTQELNFKVYDKLACEAAAAKVDIVVFPEGGLGWAPAEGPDSIWTRDDLSAFCQPVPDVGERAPCKGSNSTSSSLACRLADMSAKHNITVVADICELQPCSNSTATANSGIVCPPDGRFLWNTFVVFDGAAGGRLIAKYHKSHIWGGYFNQPNPVRTTFTSSFNPAIKFGMFVCYDMMFYEPAFGMIDEEGICNFVYSTWWAPQRPLISSAPALQQSFSRFSQVNLIASDGGGNGGGLFSNGIPLAVDWHGTEPAEYNVSKLVIADIPIQCKGSRSSSDDSTASTRRMSSVRPPSALPTLSSSPAPTGERCYVNANHDEDDSYYFHHTVRPSDLGFISEGRCSFFTSRKRGAAATPSTLPSTETESSSPKEAAAAAAVDTDMEERAKNKPLVLTATHNRLTCKATVNAATKKGKGIQDEQWALFAFDGQIGYYLTPSNQSATICAIIRCASRSSKEDAANADGKRSTRIPLCTTGYELSFHTVFADLTLESTLVQETPSLSSGASKASKTYPVRWMPIISVGDGQLLDPSKLVVSNSSRGSAVNSLHLASPESLYSALLYGLSG